MCNRVVQKDKVIKPGEPVLVLMKGPGATFELPFEAVFAGPAKRESRGYWIQREGAQDVEVVAVVERAHALRASVAESFRAGNALAFSHVRRMTRFAGRNAQFRRKGNMKTTRLLATVVGLRVLTSEVR